MKSVLNFRTGKICAEVGFFGSLKNGYGDSSYTYTLFSNENEGQPQG